MSDFALHASDSRGLRCPRTPVTTATRGQGAPCPRKSATHYANPLMRNTLLVINMQGDPKTPRHGSAGDMSLIADWLAQAAGGDRAAFASLIRVFRPEVQRVALRLVGNHEDAEDVAQDTFIRAWSGLDRLIAQHGSAAASKLGPWLMGIAVHLVRDIQRKRSRGPRRESAARVLELEQSLRARASDEPDARGKARETQALLRAAIDSLPDRLRVAIVLRAFEGLDYSTIAEITGVRAATARTQVAQARKGLRRILSTSLDIDLGLSPKGDDE